MSIVEVPFVAWKKSRVSKGPRRSGWQSKLDAEKKQKVWLLGFELLEIECQKDTLFDFVWETESDQLGWSLVGKIYCETYCGGGDPHISKYSII